MGVVRTREWSFDDVFALMCERVGISADRGHLEGQDTISAALAGSKVPALSRSPSRYDSNPLPTTRAGSSSASVCTAGPPSSANCNAIVPP